MGITERGKTSSTQKYPTSLSGTFPSFRTDSGWVGAPMHRALCGPCHQHLSPPPWQGPSTLLQAVTVLPSEAGWVTHLVLAWTSKMMKRSGAGAGLAFLASVQPASRALKGSPFSFILNIFTAKHAEHWANVTSHLQHWHAEEHHSSRLLTRSCANEARKEGSCPQICQEAALGGKDAGPHNSE